MHADAIRGRRPRFDFRMEVPMKSNLVTLAVFSMLSSSAHAAVDLVNVPIACGSVAEVHELLRINMPGQEAIGKGEDSVGNDVAVLLTDAGHWAMVTKFTDGRVCVIASGRNWTLTAPPS